MDPRSRPGWAAPVSRTLALSLAVAAFFGCSKESPPPTAEETRKVLKDAGERLEHGASTAAAVAREAARDATQKAESLARRAADETRRAAEAAARSETAQRLKGAGTQAWQQVRTQAQAGVSVARAQADAALKEASELAAQAAEKAREQARKIADKTRGNQGEASPKP